MGIGFAEYLRAKFPLDERSLNPQVRKILLRDLLSRPGTHCLDLGTGTGAMLRRLIEGKWSDRLVLTGLDPELELLAQAKATLAELLSDRGYLRTDGHQQGWADSAGRTVELHWQHSALADFHPAEACYDLITAQAFMDIVPLASTLQSVRGWLRPGGLFYATLNYDGGTHLFPPYREEGFEARLLEHYDQSMEQRRVDGKPTGGSRSGTRLHAALLAGGFEIMGFGSSDWNMTPEQGKYRDQDAVCLKTILECLQREGALAGAFAGPALAAWFLDRLEGLRSGRLGLIVHQLDILAGRP